MSSSSSFSSPSSSSIREENNGNSPPTSMLLGFQHLEEQVIIATTTTTTQLPVRNVPSISDFVGCDITIDDIQTAKQELINQKFDLKMDVNEWQKIPSYFDYDWNVTPLLHFCLVGNLLIIKLLFLIGADCAKLCGNNYWFPMLVAAEYGHLDICKWLCEYGGDAKYQINKETILGSTPLMVSYLAWRHYGRDKEGKTCRWLLQNGGGQHLSSKALRYLLIANRGGTEETNSNLLVLWMRENVQLHGTFMLLLCGATTMNTSSSSESNDGDTRKHKCTRKIHRERPLQILDVHPGIKELIGDYVGLIRGKEFRMLTEFNESVIAYHDGDDDDENSSDNDNDNYEDEDEDEE